jgi:hypothetical protein
VLRQRELPHLGHDGDAEHRAILKLVDHLRGGDHAREQERLASAGDQRVDQARGFLEAEHRPCADHVGEIDGAAEATIEGDVHVELVRLADGFDAREAHDT